VTLGTRLTYARSKSRKQGDVGEEELGQAEDQDKCREPFPDRRRIAQRPISPGKPGDAEKRRGEGSAEQEQLQPARQAETVAPDQYIAEAEEYQPDSLGQRAREPDQRRRQVRFRLPVE
jgi:hypothetical protein